MSIPPEAPASKNPGIFNLSMWAVSFELEDTDYGAGASLSPW